VRNLLVCDGGPLRVHALKRVIVAGALVLAIAVPGTVMAAGPLDGLTIPPPDPALVFVTPSPDQPNYSARALAFVQSTVPDMFISAYNDNGGMDVLGMPTSAPTADPKNPNFIYQRFQNGVLFYNATEDSFSVLPMG
jgi:hypothetical protein